MTTCSKAQAGGLGFPEGYKRHSEQASAEQKQRGRLGRYTWRRRGTGRNILGAEREILTICRGSQRIVVVVRVRLLDEEPAAWRGLRDRQSKDFLITVPHHRSVGVAQSCGRIAITACPYAGIQIIIRRARQIIRVVQGAVIGVVPDGAGVVVTDLPAFP